MNVMDFLKPFLRNGACVLGGCLVMLLLIIVIIGPWMLPYHPNETALTNSHQPPSFKNLFGTDQLGRDVFTRVIYGGRISLSIGIFSRVIAFVIGSTLGVLAGYYGKWLDIIVMRLVDMVFAFPFLLLALALTAVLGPRIQQLLISLRLEPYIEPNLVALFIALGLVGWAELARLVRGQVLAARNHDYVEAARAYGAPDRRIIFKHILPNCTSPILVWLSLGMAGAIMAEAGLSFLGLGVAQPSPSWGSMINSGLIEIRRAPWLTIAPGCALALTVLGFNLLGDGMRDVMDPKKCQ